MDEWFGLTPTGRRFKEPTGVQVELQDGAGLRHTAIVFDEPWHGHALLTRGVELVRSFLEYPMVVGLVELSHADPGRGLFVYPTGTVWTLKELMRVHADLGHAIGPRAALELCWLAGQVLVEGAENGGMQGCFSHGGLTPWRVALRGDAQLQILGYGLPQVDVLAARAGTSGTPDADSVRYAPPERLAGTAEDLSSDTVALTLIAFEILTGKPLYDAREAKDLARLVSLSEGVAMLSRPNPLPRDIAQVFARALVYDPEARLGGAAWLAEIEHLLSVHTTGDSLEAVVDRVRGASHEPGRRGVRLRQAETDAWTPEALQQAATEPSDTTLPEPERRWARSQGRRRLPSSRDTVPATPAPSPTPTLRPPSAPSTPPELPTRRRRRDNATSLAVDEEERTASPVPSLDLDDLDLGLPVEAPDLDVARGTARALPPDGPRNRPQPPPADLTTEGLPRRRRRHEP